MDEIIQLKISLLKSKPLIWRRIQVEKEITFLELHYIIQIVMGWQNGHLHQFKINNYTISEPYEDMWDFNSEAIDSSTITLDRILSGNVKKFIYEYDFGDSWNHQISVEKYLTADKKIKYPICTDGEMNCPPENCGGISGYYYMLEVINNKTHPERKEMLEWLGGKFNPNQFSINAVNKELHSLKIDN